MAQPVRNMSRIQIQARAYLHNNSEVNGIFMSTLQMEILGLREVSSAVQGHTASRI